MPAAATDWYSTKPRAIIRKNADSKGKRTNLVYSLGVIIDDKDGSVAFTRWGSPAFKAGITEATQIIAVNGIVYSTEVLTDAVRAAKVAHSPIELVLKVGNKVHVSHLEYYDGMRYPHLERDPAVAPRLDDILAARTDSAFNLAALIPRALHACGVSSSPTRQLSPPAGPCFNVTVPGMCCLPQRTNASNTSPSALPFGVSV